MHLFAWLDSMSVEVAFQTHHRKTFHIDITIRFSPNLIAFPETSP